jgi:hypothetical protein
MKYQFTIFQNLQALTVKIVTFQIQMMVTFTQLNRGRAGQVVKIVDF